MEQVAQPSVWVQCGGRGTGKTDFTKNKIKNSNRIRPQQKAIIVDTIDSVVWRTEQTFNDIQNIRPIKIITTKELPYWSAGQLYQEERIMRLISPNVNESMLAVSKYFGNGIIAIEDATRFVRNGRLTDAQAAMIYDCKQKGNDIFFNYHLLRKVPSELADMTDFLVVGKTKEEPLDKRIHYDEDQVWHAMRKAAKSKDRFIKIELDVRI